ncbi:MAG TPA: ABC transporter permease [Ktedonobacteraceae bacterium]|nr:ABC transporter permease [Ktedonobacteraceae bacterium]
MSTIAPSSLPAKATLSMGPLPGKRSMVLLLAFWHVLRRDLMVSVREWVPFIMQTLVQPFFFLLVFGRILPEAGLSEVHYAALFLPGVVALNIGLAGVQSIAIALITDLGGAREIDDRLLAPLPISLVALEKVVFATIRSLIAGAVTIPMGYLLLGSGFQVRGDMIVPLIIVMVLTALTSSALGLLFGAGLPIDKIFLLFTIVFSLVQFTGCVFFTWTSLKDFVVFQVITLLNPVTYACEGLRYAMVPPINGQNAATLPIAWVVIGLIAFFVVFLILGMRAFRKRAIS